jgi:hypothetical protein
MAEGRTNTNARMRPIALWWSAGGTLIAADRAIQADGWTELVWGSLGVFLLTAARWSWLALAGSPRDRRTAISNASSAAR